MIKIFFSGLFECTISFCVFSHCVLNDRTCVQTFEFNDITFYVCVRGVFKITLHNEWAIFI